MWVPQMIPEASTDITISTWSRLVGTRNEFYTAAVQRNPTGLRRHPEGRSNTDASRPGLLKPKVHVSHPQDGRLSDMEPALQPVPPEGSVRPADRNTHQMWDGGYIRKLQLTGRPVHDKDVELRSMPMGPAATTGRDKPSGSNSSSFIVQ